MQRAQSPLSCRVLQIREDGVESEACPAWRDHTGMSAMIMELEGKRLELLREVAPRVARVAYLTYGTDLTTQRGIKEARDAGQRLGIRIQPIRIEDPKELEGAFSAMVKERAGGVAIQPLFITSIGQGSSDRGVRSEKSAADGLGFERFCGCGRLAVLWFGSSGAVAACRMVRRQDFERCQPSRTPCRTTDKVRVCDQSESRQTDRANGST